MKSMHEHRYSPALRHSALGAAGTSPGAARRNRPFGPADAKETYYWISNKANLPLFVQYDYVGMKRIAEELGVKVIVAGPTDFDLPGFIAAVDQVCAQKPTGVSCRRRLGPVADGVGQEMHGDRACRRSSMTATCLISDGSPISAPTGPRSASSRPRS